MVRFGRHPDGTPTFLAESDEQGFYAIGWIHGRYRPLQSQLLATAGVAKLSASIWPMAALERIDRISLKLDLKARADREDAKLSVFARERLDAYLAGQRAGLTTAAQVRGRSFIASLARCPTPTRASLIAGFMLSGYLGLAESQGRMERALIELVASGADTTLLGSMFAPHLDGWELALIRCLRRPQVGAWFGRPNQGAGGQGAGGRGFGLGQAAVGGGSNAWAVGKMMTREGRALLAGDPHLQINQLPSLLFELTGRVGRDYWMGATIPGLPGIAVGRNRNVAWSGTFAVADNVDHFIERLENGCFRNGDGTLSPLLRREARLARRVGSHRNLEFYETARGVIEDEGDGFETADGFALSSRWSGVESPSEAIEAYLRLPLAKTAAEADRVLARAHTFSLHFVLADRDGDVRYRQAGTVPDRTAGWSGLFPVGWQDVRGWRGVLTGQDLPRERGIEEPSSRGFVASANEGRTGLGGRVLSTLAQPSYRLDRITEFLSSRRDHDVASMQHLQLDTFSRQSLRLRGFLLSSLGDADGPLRRALVAWDGRYDVDSPGAHAFSILRNQAIGSLSTALGGESFLEGLKTTELPVWWCEALDRALVDPETWRPRVRRAALEKAMNDVRHAVPRPWGHQETVEFAHLILGGLPSGLGANRGPFPLKGSVATVCQGHRLSLPWGEVVVAPAYRFVTDLGCDEAYTALPGGIEASPLAKTYDCWLAEYFEGRYHKLVPPQEG
ncbi:MAG: penicillin acylase family protein [Deltaproteobacteria bacterium]|nr:penicillin acylase family protein [Deltaproteobacteria bacterium]